MSQTPRTAVSRRQWLKSTGRIAAATALAASPSRTSMPPKSNTIQVALIGCGGRGTGAAGDALSVKNGPIKLVAMADVFQTASSTAASPTSKKQFGDRVDVPQDRRFIGFDAYQKAMDCLKPGDVAILATPPAFRWAHFAYAIQKGLNVFMEKPVTVDGPTTRRMLQLAEESVEKNLKVGVGLMVRHCRGRQATQDADRRRRDRRHRRHAGLSDERASGDHRPQAGQRQRTALPDRAIPQFPLGQRRRAIATIYIHQIDECCWMKGAWPVQAQALGGRHFRGNSVDQNLDTYSIEYTFPDGAKLFYFGRNMSGCHDEFASYAQGSKGAAVISTSGHTPGRVRTFKGLRHDQGPAPLGLPAARAKPLPARMG